MTIKELSEFGRKNGYIVTLTMGIGKTFIRCGKGNFSFQIELEEETLLDNEEYKKAVFRRIKQAIDSKEGTFKDYGI